MLLLASKNNPALSITEDFSLFSGLIVSERGKVKHAYSTHEREKRILTKKIRSNYLRLQTIGTDCGNGSKLISNMDFENGKANGCGIEFHPCGDTQGRCGCQNTGIQIVNRSDGHPTRGDYSFRAELSDCHERAEIASSYGPKHGQVTWWGWSTFIPKDFRYQNKGSIIVQFHDNMGCGGACGAQNNLPPPCPDYKRGGPSTFILSSKGTLGFSMRHQVNGCVKRTSLPIRNPLSTNQILGSWVNFVVQARFTSETNGFYRMWMWQGDQSPSKEPNINYSGATSFEYTDGRNGKVIYRVGIYRGDPGKVGGGKVFLYHDDIKYGLESDGVAFTDVAPSGIVQNP